METVFSEGPDGVHLYVPRFPLNYAQFFLSTSSPNAASPAPLTPGEASAGILRTYFGSAFLATGLATGNTELRVSVHAYAPSPLLEDYEDVVEASMEGDGPISVVPWGDHRSFELPTPSSATGWYRLRYHARNMDQCRDLRSKEPIDSFHLQIWPAPPNPPSILKITSEHARGWL